MDSASALHHRMHPIGDAKLYAQLGFFFLTSDIGTHYADAKKSGLAQQNMPPLRSPVQLAKEMGEGVG